MTVHSDWKFDYRPIANGGGDDGSPESDLVIATRDDIDPGIVAELLSSAVGSAEVTPLFSAHPIFWTRVQASERVDRWRLAQALTQSGVDVRYVVSARRGSQRLAPRLDTESARPRRGYDWTTRSPTRRNEPPTRWRWFLRSEGVNVTRSVCGSGAGTRLAIIDNDGRYVDQVDVDAEVLINCDSMPRAGAHAGLLLGWAVGARDEQGGEFRGVAPDASPRLYCIPKGGDEIVSLPLALARAVEDGADVIVCSTYVDGQTSPLLDDALEFATRLGRAGRGSVVIMPTGREMSSPASSVHSSLSLGLAEPASDPRVFCVGPSARDGGWFLWRDRQGKFRPFANRGPAIRWLAPGDDLAYPFASDDRPAHAESSGAAAVASGVVLLVLAKNPSLDVRDLDQLLLDTLVKIEPEGRAGDLDLSDRADLLPTGRDPDGHNAKHGYGRTDASAACLAGSDPLCSALVRIGEDEAARRYAELASELPEPLYTLDFARWSARVLLRDAAVRHALCSVARAIRLMLWQGSNDQVPGALLRQLGVGLRLLSRASPRRELAEELARIDKRITGILADDELTREADEKLFTFAKRLFVAPDARTQALGARHASILGDVGADLT